MEKEKNGIRCSYAVLVIILFAALAFVVDYSIIERKLNKCVLSSANIDAFVVDTNNLRDIAHINDYGEVIVTKDGNVLYRPYDKYNLIDSDFLVKGEYEVDDYILGPDEKYEGYKVNTSNIRSAYSFPVGNGGITTHVVLLTSDNKVEILKLSNSSYDNIEVTFEKVESLSNIVSVVESVYFDSHGYVFLDSFGNQYTNGN